MWLINKLTHFFSFNRGGHADRIFLLLPIRISLAELRGVFILRFAKWAPLDLFLFSRLVFILKLSYLWKSIIVLYWAQRVCLLVNAFRPGKRWLDTLCIELWGFLFLPNGPLLFSNCLEIDANYRHSLYVTNFVPFFECRGDHCPGLRGEVYPVES